MIAENEGGRMFCVLDTTEPHRGSLKPRWMTKIIVNGVKVYPFTIGDTALEACKAAQDRAAALVRGLQDMESAIKNGPTVTISRGEQ